MSVQRRMTKQRLVIYNYVRNCGYHPSAEEVHKTVLVDNPNISLATVYRNLNLLVETGALGKISIGSMADRFDGNISKHNHFLCECCGKVIDIFSNFSVNDINLDKSVQIKNYDLTVYGICEHCSIKTM